MKVKQLSVFLENKAGRLSEVCDVLGRTGVNIRALTIAETEDFGVLRMVVDKPEEAVKALKDQNFVVNQTPVVAVEVEDKPGGLAKILSVLSRGGINVEYMYGFVEKASDKALMVFRFEDPEKAAGVLEEAGVKTLEAGQILDL